MYWQMIQCIFRTHLTTSCQGSCRSVFDIFPGHPRLLPIWNCWAVAGPIIFLLQIVWCKHSRFQNSNVVCIEGLYDHVRLTAINSKATASKHTWHGATPYSAPSPSMQSFREMLGLCCPSAGQARLHGSIHHGGQLLNEASNRDRILYN